MKQRRLIGFVLSILMAGTFVAGPTVESVRAATETAGAYTCLQWAGNELLLAWEYWDGLRPLYTQENALDAIYAADSYVSNNCSYFWDGASWGWWKYQWVTANPEGTMVQYAMAALEFLYSNGGS